MPSINPSVSPPAKHSAPRLSKQRQTPDQPLDVINVPGALLKLETLAAISGRSVNTLFRDASVERGGILVLTKIGQRCTRVSSENAREYLKRLAGGGDA